MNRKSETLFYIIYLMTIDEVKFNELEWNVWMMNMAETAIAIAEPGAFNTVPIGSINWARRSSTTLFFFKQVKVRGMTAPLKEIRTDQFYVKNAKQN